jgi:hypothetical protein
MSYDPWCLDLAKRFLEDEPNLDTGPNQADLAQCIQDAIENWFGEKKDEELKDVHSPEL